jgi:crotonobetainyl-CoA:carnitine CoA-transferase CaiB-like acyl-CoA transferase
LSRDEIMGQVAYGTLIQCFTGWSALQGYPGPDPDRGGIWTDPMVVRRRRMEVFLVNAALHRCWERGEGEYIDLSMAESTTMLLPEVRLRRMDSWVEPRRDHAMNGRVRQPMGNRHPAYAPHGNSWVEPGRDHPCRGEDQWIGVAVSNDGQWSASGGCQVLAFMGRAESRPSELLDDPRFSQAFMGRAESWIEPGRDSRPSRWQNQDGLDVVLAWATGHHDALELMDRLQQSGMPAGASLSVDQLWGNPHPDAASGSFFQPYQDPDGTTRELPAVPWRFNGEAEARMTAQPLAGQHNPYVFQNLSPDEVQALRIERGRNQRTSRSFTELRQPATLPRRPEAVWLC